MRPGPQISVRPTSASSRSSGHWVAASLSARAGSGWVSRKNPSAPATAAAAISAGMCSRWPPLAPPAPCPGCCTAWVASNTTGAPVAARSRVEVAHVDHQVAVAEEGAALGHGDVGAAGRSAPCRRRRPSPRPASTGPSSRSPGGRCGRRRPADRSAGRGRPGSGARPPPPPRARPAPDSWMSVSTGRPLDGAHPLEHPSPSSSPDRGARRPGRGWPCRSWP